MTGHKSSPRRRGLTHVGPRDIGSHAVFPAQAGVSPPRSKPGPRPVSLPRASGGEPEWFAKSVTWQQSSPCRRGLAHAASQLTGGVIVFPA